MEVVMVDQATLAVLREFAHGLVKPGREVRMIVLKDVVPQLGLMPGDGVVYAAGQAAAGGRWRVLKTLGPDRKPRFTLDTVTACPRVHAGGLARRVCLPAQAGGQVLFTIREYDETTGEETHVR
jgi:hypothetical protein